MNNIEMHSRIGRANEEEIDNLRTKLAAINISLPKMYSSFLQENGGGQPLKERFNVNDDMDVFIDCFFGVSENSSLDVYHMAVTLHDRIPSDLIPIGTDGIGNFICMGSSDANLNKIYMWWADGQSEPGKKLKHDNIQLIANSFDELINNLK